MKGGVKLILFLSWCSCAIEQSESLLWNVSLKTIQDDLSRILLWPRSFRFGPKDALPETSELIERGGYPSEMHMVVSSDGYVLALDRIPYNPQNIGNSTASNFYKGRSSSSNTKPVVLLMPGYLTCSDVWFANTDKNNLPFLLSQSGFDVWIGSPRGCSSSRKNVGKNVKPSMTQFWNFGFHEMALNDLSLTIDYILKTTGQPQLSYIGHSMGSTMSFVLLSMRPEYNRKIKMSISLAPVAYLRNMSSPLVRAIAFLIRILPDYLVGSLFSLGTQELWPRSDFFQNIFRNFCKNEERRQLCMAVVFTFVGFDYCQANLTNLPEFLKTFPAGSSARAGVHFAQLLNTDKFQMFNFGPVRNLVEYKNTEPPEYPLKNIQTPQTFFWGENDWFSDPQDVLKLSQNMPAVKESCRVRLRRWNHFDYIAAKDAHQLVNKRVVRVLNGESCRLPGEDDMTEDESINCDHTDVDDGTAYGNLLMSFEKLERIWRV